MKTPRIKQFCSYLKKTCRIRDHLSYLTDNREDPYYPTQMLAAASLLGFSFRLKSTRELCRRLQRKGWRRLLGLPLLDSTPVEGTFRYFYPRLHTASLRRGFVASVNNMRLAKMHCSSQFNGLRVLSIDGHRPFSTHQLACSGCIEHKRRKAHAQEHEPPHIWYDHRIITARLVGDSFSPWLGFLSQDPETDKGGYEGELTAAPRLLAQIEDDYGTKTIDVVLADALHACKSFIEECEKRGWYATFIAKGNVSLLQKEFESRPLPEPVKVTKKVHEGQVTATIWRHEDLYLLTCDLPLQVLKVHQLVETMEGEVIREDIRWVASRIPTERLESYKLWWMGWRRWESENGGHRNLKREHHGNHVFCHKNHAAIENVLWLLMWGQNLLEAFYQRRLQSGRWKSPLAGLRALVEELVEQMAANEEHRLFEKGEWMWGSWRGS